MNSQIDYNPKAFLKKWTVLFLARLFPLIVLFIITIFFSRRLSYSDYGIFQSVWMYSNIINVVITFGFTSLILSSNITFLFGFIQRNRKDIFTFYSLVIIISIFILYVFAKNISRSTLLLMLIFILLQNLSSIRETFLIKHGKENKLFIINCIYSFLFLLWHVYILFNNYDLNNLICGVIVFLFLKIILLKYKSFDLNNPNDSFLQDNIFFKHWLFLGINDIAGVASKWIDKLFLLYLLTPTDFAIFFNGSFEIPFFALLITVAGNLLMIEVSQNIQSTDKVISTFNNNYKLLSSIVFPVFLFLFFYSNELFTILFDHKYDASIPIFMVSIFILPIRLNNYGALLQCYSKGKIILTGSILDLVVVLVLMFTLYPFMFTKGVAVAVVIGTYIQIGYYLIKSARIMKVPISSLFPYKYLCINFLILFAIAIVFHTLTIGKGDHFKILNGLLIMVLSIFAGLIKFIKAKISQLNAHIT